MQAAPTIIAGERFVSEMQAESNGTAMGTDTAKLLLKEEFYAVMGAAMEVHRVLGPGFLEPVYQEALQFELSDRAIPFEADKLLPISYKGRTLEKYYKADVICYGQLILELKALDCLTGREEAQLLNYLKATGLRVGLLINFGSTGRLEWLRRVL
jgi:GxxExxY protein